MIIIVTLATDSFIQAAVTYPLRPKVMTAAAIPISTNYSLHGDNYLTSLCNAWDADPSMKAAIYAGEFSSGKSSFASTIVLTCSTGNCTVDSYMTLELEAQCTDQTVQLAINESKTINNASWPLGLDFGNATLWLTAGPNLANFITMNTKGYGGLQNTTDVLPISSTSLIACLGHNSLQ